MRHMVPFYKRLPFPGDGRGDFGGHAHRWDRCEEASQGGHLSKSSLAGQAVVLHCPRGPMHTHHGGSVPVWV